MSVNDIRYIHTGVQHNALLLAIHIGKSMIGNVTFFATLHYIFHSYYIMHAFQELVLLP